MQIATNLKRTLFTALFSFTVFASAFSVFPYTASAADASNESIILPCADVLEWKYKIEDGKMYKRLYNTTTDCWEGDWIYVCDYPE